MKQMIGIVLVLFLLLPVTGCAAPSDAPLKTTHSETADDPVETTAATPSEAATLPEQTVPGEAAAAAGFGDVYADILRLLESGSWDLEYTYANIGMMEVVSTQSTKEDRYGSITYALEDMDNDGTLEMIVLDAMGNTRILAIYAVQNGQIAMTHEGWARSRLYRLSDGALYSEGSGGAAYAIFEAYGQRWFTYPKGEDQTQIGFYHAFDGSYDPMTAQEISADAYNTRQAELAQKITAFSVYPFK